VVAVAEHQVLEVEPSHRRAIAAGVTLGLLSGVALGYAGWVLPTAGGSVLIPTFVVFGIGAVVALAGWALAIVRPGRHGPLAFAAVVGLCTLVASVWTFQFSLAARVSWGSDATTQAQLALVQLGQSPKYANGAPERPCVVVDHDSVGPLEAPYRRCAVSASEGYAVTFAPVGAPSSGLAFTDMGGAAFPDECSRHLSGQWWTYHFDTSGTGSCPFGYAYHGAA
jgi:hypothetical protein